MTERETGGPARQTPNGVIGQIIGNCVIETLIGQGGMARVYRARQENLDRSVAVKILPPYYAADPAFVERFKLEARALARLSHPHIVIVHDAGEDSGHLYIVMEYISGGNLRDYMEQPLTLREVTRIVREVSSALTYAHSQGIIHRDVKPVNVLMDTNKRMVLSDFGIAKVMATSAALTRSGAGVGTPEYMSPEQCRGGQVDQRADIYALGVMLYELLTGHTPFEADNYTALAHSHIYEMPTPPSQLNPRISPAVQAVVMKALEKDPAYRFQEATELSIALDQAAAAQSPVMAPSARRQAPATAPISAQRAGVTCPRCHAINNAQQRYCSTCGQPLQPGLPAPISAQRQTGGLTSGSIVCPHCQALNKGINRFCTSCGGSLMQGVAGKQCRNCGLRNRAGVQFCTNCGEPLN
ncbi:MAG TPA: protein kinase [Ktedonobacterales bacterium]|nr:protein kinase [Ktedonobacterales bacterium]